MWKAGLSFSEACQSINVKVKKKKKNSSSKTTTAVASGLQRLNILSGFNIFVSYSHTKGNFTGEKTKT